MNGIIDASKFRSKASLSEEQLAELDVSLRRYCRSLTGSIVEGEDLAQESWTKAWKKLKGEGHANTEALLMRIAKTTWIDVLRKKARQSRIVREEAEAVQQPEADALETELIVQALMKHLSQLQLLVFMLREVWGYSIESTAELLRTTQGAVKAAHHRARTSLPAIRKELLEEVLAEPKETDAIVMIRSIAVACRQGEVNALIALVQNDPIHTAAAVGLAQNRLIQQKQRMSAATIKQDKENMLLAA